MWKKVIKLIFLRGIKLKKNVATDDDDDGEYISIVIKVRRWQMNLLQIEILMIFINDKVR